MIRMLEFEKEVGVGGGEVKIGFYNSHQDS
jgi:hypothetical protein